MSLPRWRRTSASVKHTYRVWHNVAKWSNQVHFYFIQSCHYESTTMSSATLNRCTASEYFHLFCISHLLFHHDDAKSALLPMNPASRSGLFRDHTETSVLETPFNKAASREPVRHLKLDTLMYLNWYPVAHWGLPFVSLFRLKPLSVEGVACACVFLAWL